MRFDTATGGTNFTLRYIGANFSSAHIKMAKFNLKTTHCCVRNLCGLILAKMFAATKPVAMAKSQNYNSANEILHFFGSGRLIIN